MEKINFDGERRWNEPGIADEKWFRQILSQSSRAAKCIRHARARQGRPGEEEADPRSREGRMPMREENKWSRKRESRCRRAPSRPQRRFLPHDSPKYDIMRAVLKPHEHETTCLTFDSRSNGTTDEPHDRHVRCNCRWEKEKERKRESTPRCETSRTHPFFTDGMLCRAPRISDALYHNAGYDLISSVNRWKVYTQKSFWI